jgi:hypothetical protein
VLLKLTIVLCLMQLYVVAHANLQTPHAILSLVKMFSTKEMLSSELGYYLCVWEGLLA